MTGEVLSSWKEIAAYLGKGVRTVQRWEAEMGLPVHRPGSERHIVIAIPAELDAWVQNGRPSHGDDLTTTGNRAAQQKLLREQQVHLEQHRRHAVQLKRMRTLMGSIIEHMERNREHASRLVAQVTRHGRNGDQR